MLERARKVLNQGSAILHDDARLLLHPLAVAFDDGFMLPALDLFNLGFLD